MSNELDCNGARSENIMDPCRESEVVHMYDNMKTQSWGETKEKLSKRGLQGTQLREHAANLIKVHSLVFYVYCCFYKFIFFILNWIL